VGRDLEKAAETERAAQHAEDAVRHASDEASHLCSFSADTAVTTPDGLRPISSLKIGDLVLAYNQQTGTTGYYPITALLVHPDPTLVTLTIDGATIVTTPEHPFYTADGHWTPAGDLRVGSRVREANGSYGVVQSVILVQHPQVMYNLTVEGAHTFFVGTARVLVHNTCVPINRGKLPPEAEKTLQNIDQGGPFPYPQDDQPFKNLEKRLPQQPYGYYKEYTVTTPGAPHRGQRRIVEGANGEQFYTNDHYTTFWEITQ